MKIVLILLCATILVPIACPVNDRGVRAGRRCPYGGSVAGASGGRLVLDKRFQPRERVIPLPGDAIEGAPGLVEPPRVELEEVLAPLMNAPDEAGVSKNPEMFGDRLAREWRAFRKTCNRAPRPSAERRQ